MQRGAFGPLAALGDTELAQLLVLAGLGCSWPLLRDRQAVPPRALSAAGANDWGPLQSLRLERIEQFGAAARAAPAAESDAVRLAAQTAWQRLGPRTGERLRLSVDLRRASSDSSRQVDVPWLLDLLARSFGPGLVAASAAWASRPGSFSWDWPLGTMIDTPLSPLASEWPQRFALARFLAPVDLQSGAAACELLLVTGSLDAAAQLTAQAAVQATVVLVLGEEPRSWADTARLVDTVRTQVQAGAMLVCGLPAAQQAGWFEAFVEELSHNRPLDVAASHAARSGGPLPFVVGDGQFLSLSSVAHTARRIGAAAARPPVSAAEPPVLVNWPFTGPPPVLPQGPTRGGIGEAMVRNAERMDWNHESGDASSLVQVREALSRAVGGLELAPIPAGAAPAPTGAEPVEREARPPSDTTRGAGPPAEAAPAIDARPVAAPRWVQADLHRLDRKAMSSRIVPGAPYTIDVSISPEHAAAIIAPVPLDESSLPPSPAGHELRIAFTPLWPIAPGRWQPGQVEPVSLPAQGASSKASFHFVAPPDAAAMRARILVLAEKRVLQTLLLATQPATRGTDGSMEARLELENLVSADFGERTVAPSFGASIVLNHSPAGATGVTVVGEGVEFFEPAGIDKVLELARGALEALNAPDDSDKLILGLDKAPVRVLMLKLAKYGQAIRRELTAQDRLQGLLATDRIQFVEARQRGYFPLEIVYDGKAPDDNAELCPNAAKALKQAASGGADDVHRNCPHASSRKHYCPAAFWGLSKCIERHAEDGRPNHRFAQPTPADATLKPFGSALLAASNNVRRESLAPPKGLEAILKEAGMRLWRAKNWEQWRDLVAQHAPATLVLLPHSLESELAALPALEIGGSADEISGMDEDYVAPAGKHPLVLVLGCSTALTEIHFCNSISQFRRAGAAITLGTVALIRGRQAVLFVKALLEGLREAGGTQARFDEALLKVKRRMLAAGDPFVFSLVCYGDTSWRIGL